MQHHVHWLTATTHIEHLDLIENISGLLHLDPVHIGRGRNRYANCVIFSNIASVMWSEDREECCYEFTGTACELLGTLTVLQSIDMFSAKATRIDLAVDGCPFTPVQVREHCNAYKGHTMHGLRSRINKDKFDWRENDQGNTFYLGSRQSLRTARIYDRNIDDNGENFTRFEIEIKKSAAEKVARLLADDYLNFETHVMSVVRDFVDFVEVGVSNNARAQMTSWWADFVNDVSKTTIKYSNKIVATIETTVKYMLQNAANFYVMLNAFQVKTGITDLEFLSMYKNEGRIRSKLKHKNLIKLMGKIDMQRLTI